jgi:hypothetical protein
MVTVMTVVTGSVTMMAVVPCGESRACKHHREKRESNKFLHEKNLARLRPQRSTQNHRAP